MDPETRFLEKVNKTPTCWLWTAQTNNKGYGCFSYNSRLMYAHRMAWMLFRGALPLHARVLHRCDNPPCCNPEHLFLGTQEDNMRDCSAKGRIQCGARHVRAKLTNEQVALIRADTRPQRVIGADFGIHQMTVSDIQRGKTWNHLP